MFHCSVLASASLPPARKGWGAGLFFGFSVNSWLLVLKQTWLRALGMARGSGKVKGGKSFPLVWRGLDLWCPWG